MTVYVECPRRPPRTLYDELVTVHDPDYERQYLPVDPGPHAGSRARARYAKELAAHAALLAKQKEVVMPPREGMSFLCGRIFEQAPFCPCGHTAEMLCDYPMGEGRTCDLPVCWCCSKHLGEEQDLCLIHFAEFLGKARVERINPWPPKRFG